MATWRALHRTHCCRSQWKKWWKWENKTQVLLEVPLWVAVHSAGATLLKTKSAFPTVFCRNPFPTWTKRQSMCTMCDSTGGSIPLLTFIQKEQSPLRLFLCSPVLDKHFVRAWHRTEPALAIAVNEDEAFRGNWIWIFFLFFFLSTFQPWLLFLRQESTSVAHPDRLCWAV